MPRSRLPVATWGDHVRAGWRGRGWFLLVLCRAGGSRGALQESTKPWGRGGSLPAPGRSPSRSQRPVFSGLRSATTSSPSASAVGGRRPAPRARATSPRTSDARRASTPPIWTPSSASASDLFSVGTTSTCTRWGGNRWLWLFQDAFIDHPGQATNLDGVGFAHNAALVQPGTCFTLHRGSAAGLPRSSPARARRSSAAGGGHSVGSWRMRCRSSGRRS